jgi:5-methylcytosine-specific restriction protein B
LFPDYNLLAKELGFDNFSNVQNKKSNLDNVSKDDRIKLLSILALHEINTRIVDPELFKLGRERQVGHTYLLPKNNSFNFVSSWKYDVIPLLEEFFFAKANVLQELFSETIFSEKEGIKDFDEDELIASLKSIVTKQKV